ncbi:MAG: YetF domain-containing protein [Lewinella sp.]
MDFSEMMYQDWAGLVRTLIVGTVGYVFMVFALRISGNRTLAKLNAFDLAVSVAFGSVFASMLLSEGVALMEGILAISLLCFLQFLLAYFSVRSEKFASLVRSEPVILVRKGEIQPQAIHDARLTERELFAIARSHGHHNLDDIDLIILESDGGFSVIGQKKRGDEESDDDDNPLPTHS